MDQVYVVRHKVLIEGVSVRRVAREMGIPCNTVRRYVEGAEPGVRKPVARACPVLERITRHVEALLSDAPRWTGGKQRLTATRVHRLSPPRCSTPWSRTPRGSPPRVRARACESAKESKKR